jgi:hypothetical protein
MRILWYLLTALFGLIGMLTLIRILSKGLADETQVAYPDRPGIPPQTYEIRIKWAKQEIVRRWYHSSDHQVPEKYLQVLEEFQEKVKQPVLKQFIEENREIVASTAAEQALAADAAIASFYGISRNVACVRSRSAAEAKR